MSEGPRAKAQRYGKPHCIRAPDGRWIAVSPGGHIRWAGTPRQAALNASFDEWLSRQLVRTPIDPYDYEQMRRKFADYHRHVVEAVTGVMPCWDDVMTVRH